MSTIKITETDREAYEKDKQFLWLHCAHEHDLHMLETEEFDLWLVATRSLRAELAVVKASREQAIKDAIDKRDFAYRTIKRR